MSASTCGGPGIRVQVEPNSFRTKSLSTVEAVGGCWAIASDESKTTMQMQRQECIGLL